MGKPPHLKTRVKSMLHRKEALALVGQGLPITTIAEQMGMAVQSVRRLLRQALATESMFPSTLSPERVAELRVLEAEQIAASVRKVVSAQDNAIARLRDKSASVQAAAEISVVRCHEALMRSSERLAKLFGLDQPTAVVSKMLEVSYHRSEQRIEITFDAGVLEPPQEPIPGLEIFEGNYGNGNTEHPQLPDTAAAAVATELPG